MPPKKKKAGFKRARSRIRKSPSGFNIDARFPDWLADEAFIDERKSKLKDQVLFPDELLGTKTSKTRQDFLPFQPKIKGISALESAVSGWLVGHELEKPTRGSEKFWEFLVGLMEHIRRYNCSLYWLRLHHLVKAGTDVSSLDAFPIQSGAKGKKKERNPKDIETDTTSATFKKTCKDAEADWDSCVKGLRSYIQGGFTRGGTNWGVIVDTVKVNDYVVSVRTVANPGVIATASTATAKKLKKAASTPEMRIREFGGSSSSHNYVSSAFSSYQP